MVLTKNQYEKFDKTFCKCLTISFNWIKSIITVETFIKKTVVFTTLIYVYFHVSCINNLDSMWPVASYFDQIDQNKTCFKTHHNGLIGCKGSPNSHRGNKNIFWSLMIPLLSPRWHIDKGGWWERGGWRANVRERQALDGYAPKVHEIFRTWNSNGEYFQIGAGNPKREDYLNKLNYSNLIKCFPANLWHGKVKRLN